MRIAISRGSVLSAFIFWFAFAGAVFAQESGESGIELFAADGQLFSHPFRVFVTHDITSEMNPRLQLLGSHSVTSVHAKELEKIAPMAVARNQRIMQKVAGQEIQMTGTLLLFDLTKYPVRFYKAMVRLTPILTWNESTMPGGGESVAVAPHEINIGNIRAAVVWTLIITGLLVAFILSLGKRDGVPVITFLCGDDNTRLSLSRTQVAVWTVAIGMVIGGYGLVRLEVPEIPESLVVLMGMSLVTGGISYMKRGSRGDAARSKDEPKLPRFADLVSEVGPDGKETLSLTRGQMLFWTGLTVVLFVAKSALDGVLWEVPWQLVALMGISQVSYLSPMLAARQQ